MAGVTPQIIMPERGVHNSDLQVARARLIKGNTYRDCSTVCIVPTRGTIHARVIQSWFSMVPMMNQKFMRVFMTHMEVADAYNTGIEMIMANPELSSWKYLLTVEDDNMPPPDGLQKLIEAIEGNVDGVKYDVVGGLYWTKGEGGQPMIYGDPTVMPKNFIPQVPRHESVQHCNGLGMGFNLWRLDIFKDKRLRKPWFKTAAEWDPSKGVRCYTQDLYFYEDAAKHGYRFACDTRVKVGHYDAVSDIVW
jgi:hypothetical protein